MAGEIEKEDIEYFLAIGALEFCYTNKDGEEIYKLTKEAKIIAPEFYYDQIKELNSVVFSLWNKGVIEVSFDDDGDPLIGLPENMGDFLRNNDLEKEELDLVEEIILSWYSK
jgi:hypothetical protein